MGRHKNKASLHFSWDWWSWAVTGLNILALVLSATLSWHYLKGGSMVGCDGGSPCDLVLNSRWSVLAGVFPVSGLAMSAYLALLVAGFFIGADIEVSVRRIAWGAMLIIAGAILGSAVWFTLIQKLFIGNFCVYCMTTHSVGMLLAALIIWRALKDGSERMFRPLPAIGLVFVGLLMAGILAFSQVSLTTSAATSEAGSQNKLPEVDYHNVPMIGSPDALYKVTMLFDYECSHCQKIHFMLEAAVRRYHGKLAFVLRPTPLNSHCNPYIPRDVDAFKNSCELAKIGLAVWHSNREAFSSFDNWMFSFESGDKWHPRSPEAARAKAVELVGRANFNAALSNPWLGKYLQDSVRIFGQTLQSGKGGIPKLIFNSRWVIPEPYDADDFISILQKSLEVPKP